MFNRQKFRFRGLFAVLLVIGGISPLLRQGPISYYLLQLLLTVVFLGALNAVSEGRRPLRTGLVLAIPAILATWVSNLGPAGDGVYLAALVFSSLFLAFTIVHILDYVLKARRVSSEVLFGALSVYLLIGLIFALIFTTLEVIQPGSLSLPNPSPGPVFADATQFSTVHYFSFVTLTTLGYGDIGPLTAAARSLATLEALMGQLFLAVLIARLVALHIVHESEGGGESGVG